MTSTRCAIGAGFLRKTSHNRFTCKGWLRSREHDDRNTGCRPVRAQPAAQSNAIHTWHHPVRHDKVGALFFGEGSGGFPVERGQHTISLALEKYLKWAEEFRIVVNEKNGRHRVVKRSQLNLRYTQSSFHNPGTGEPPVGAIGRKAGARICLRRRRVKATRPSTRCRYLLLPPLQTARRFGARGSRGDRDAASMR